MDQESKTYCYEEGRDRIRNGDIVFVSRSTIVAKVIRFVTNSQYSHVGIAFWATIVNKPRLMICEAQGRAKRRILNMSYYKDNDLDIVEPLVAFEQYSDMVLSRLGQVNYGWGDVIYVGIREFLLNNFNISIKARKFPGQICSELVAILNGLERTDVSPQRLFEILTKDNHCKVHTRIRKERN